jgi:H+-translocating NAD(P) transhydrogenase subunit alpha
MTGAFLVALYLFTLAVFLGLDVIRKVPPTLHGTLAIGMAAVAALVVAVALSAASASTSRMTQFCSYVAVVVATAGVVAGLLRAHRSVRGGHRR